MWKEAEDFLKEDKHLGFLVVKHGPCRIKKRDKRFYFDDIASSIIEQQLSGKAADAIYKRVKEGVMGNTKQLLTPEAILRKKDSQLRSFGISWGKASYLKDLSKKVMDGELDLSKVDKLDDEDIINELVKVKGIGRWTAEMFLMFTLARPDIFPLDDLGIKNGLRLLTTGSKNRMVLRRASGSERMNKEMSKDEMDRFATRWKPWRTVASWYVWRVLEND